jgi:allantoin racemase
MAPLCRELTQRLGVPVIDGVSVAVKWAEALAALGLQTSKGGDYALPLPKSYSGWAQAQGWPARQTPD